MKEGRSSSLQGNSLFPPLPPRHCAVSVAADKKNGSWSLFLNSMQRCMIKPLHQQLTSVTDDHDSTPPLNLYKWTSGGQEMVAAEGQVYKSFEKIFSFSLHRLPLLLSPSNPYKYLCLFYLSSFSPLPLSIYAFYISLIFPCVRYWLCKICSEFPGQRSQVEVL